MQKNDGDLKIPSDENMIKIMYERLKPKNQHWIKLCYEKDGNNLEFMVLARVWLTEEWKQNPLGE